MPYTNEEMLESLRKLLRIPSVSGHGANPGQPYGKEVDEALDHTLALCRSLGMRTTKLPGKTAWAEIGQGTERADGSMAEVPLTIRGRPCPAFTLPLIF